VVSELPRYWCPPFVDSNIFATNLQESQSIVSHLPASRVRVVFMEFTSPTMNADVPDGSIGDGCISSASSSSSSASSSSSSTTSEDCHPESTPDPLPIDIDVSSLPSLLMPNFDVKRRETAGGAALVNILILSFVGLTHGVALTAVGGFEKESTFWWTFLVLIYTCALTALLSLVGLFCTDPGVVQRSAETCFPIPAPADVWIASHVKQRERQEDNDSKVDDSNRLRPTELYIASPDGNGDSYCVRCLVWRRNSNAAGGIKYFHCTTCQRCVRHFDHHCSIFGRCIAGKGLHTGNIKYFYAIIASGMFAYFITVISLIWSLSIRFGPKWAVPLSLVVLWVVQVNLFNKNPTALCMGFRRIVVTAVECVSQCSKRKARAPTVGERNNGSLPSHASS
jgi:hypothetical protein